MALKSAKEAGAKKKAPASSPEVKQEKAAKLVEQWILPGAPQGKSRCAFFFRGEEVALELVDGRPKPPFNRDQLRAGGFIEDSFWDGDTAPPEEELRYWRVTLLHPSYPVVTDGNFACFIDGEEMQFKLEDGRITSDDERIIRGLIRAGFGEIGREKRKPIKKEKKDDSKSDDPSGSR